MSVARHRYLIIGGAPKAGTTSLYKWLSDHPEVCASSLKETRFFLDAGYPLPCVKRFNGTNLAEYDGFYRHCRDSDRPLRVDATPDYLYSRTALRIVELLPRARIVFILRDPVERMVSWYKYARQKGLISEGVSFDEYVMAQVGKPITSDTPVHLRALDQCRYDQYLPAFREAFGEHCLTIDFNELKADPRLVMARLCLFAGLKDDFYDGYQFKAENVSHQVRNNLVMRGYTSIRRKLSHALHGSPVVMQLLKKPNRIIKRMLSINVKECDQVIVSPKIASLIVQDISAIHKLGIN